MKKFFAILFLIAIVALAGYLIFNKEKSAEWQDNPENLYQAKYYEKLSGNMVQCFLCPNRCILSEGQHLMYFTHKIKH